MHVILTAAGRSTRFGLLEGRPKWMLTHPSGNLMIHEVLNGIPESWPVTLVMTREHDLLWRAEDALRHYPRVRRLLLDTHPPDQVDSVLAALDYLQGEPLEGYHDEPFLVRDADNAMVIPEEMGFADNAGNVAVADVSRIGRTRPGDKSYVRCDANGRVMHISEKRVVGSIFSAGAYKFPSATIFRQGANATIFHQKAAEYQPVVGERHISHVIFEIVGSTPFWTTDVTESYRDFGTPEAWQQVVREHTTYFVDLDGVLVYNGGAYTGEKWTATLPIQENIAALNALPFTTTIILTTSRPDTMELRDQLRELGIRYDRLIGGLPHAPRVLINDTAPSLPGLTATAITLSRNSPELGVYLG